MPEVDALNLPPCDALYVSPHADDAVLSCAARLASDAARGARVLVLWLFAGEDDGPVEAALRAAGVACASADLPAAARRSPAYATFRALAQDRVPEDEQLVSRAVDLLREVGARTRPRDVYVPLGVGGHIDHRLAHECCLRAFESGDGRNVFLFEDRPESLVPGAVRVRLAELGAALPPGAAGAATAAGLARFLLRFHVPPRLRGDIKGWGERLRSTAVGTRQWRRARSWQPLRGLGPRLQPVVHVDDDVTAVVEDLLQVAAPPYAAEVSPSVQALAADYVRGLGARGHAERYWLLLPSRAALFAPGGEEPLPA